MAMAMTADADASGLRTAAVKPAESGAPWAVLITCQLTPADTARMGVVFSKIGLGREIESQS